jgi:hypothetical protein
MAGPYKMCQSCNGPGTRCKRCPLEDEDDDLETNDSNAGSDLSVAYDDERHGFCVYEQHRRGEYRVVAGPFIDAAEAHDAIQNTKLTGGLPAK